MSRRLVIVVTFSITGGLLLRRRIAADSRPIDRKFTYRSVYSVPTSMLWDFHHNPRALQQLTPPPIRVQIIRDDRVSLTEGVLEFVLWFGPFPVRWVARHDPGPSPVSFRDRMILGPLESWTHDHEILDCHGQVILVDSLRYQYRSGWRGLLSRAFFNTISLRFLFAYRHWQTRLGIQRAEKNWNPDRYKA